MESAHFFAHSAEHTIHTHEFATKREDAGGAQFCNVYAFFLLFSLVHRAREDVIPGLRVLVVRAHFGAKQNMLGWRWLGVVYAQENVAHTGWGFVKFGWRGDYLVMVR